MSWQDRDYASDDNPMRRFGRPGGDWRGLRPVLDNPLTWSVQLGRILGVTVRVHVLFLVFIVIELLRPLFGSTGLGVGPTVLLLVCLFGVVLVHEFGHCLACRWSGGSANEILMWPLGGLAFCIPRERWTSHLITAAGGPMVNVILLAVLVPTIGLWTGAWWGVAIPNPLSLTLPAEVSAPWLLMALYLLNAVSLILLLFNLLPIFPLDGGRILQTVLWPKIGYVRSMRYAVRTGYVGAICLLIMGLVIGPTMLVLIAVFGGFTCYITHRQLQFTQETLGFESDDYSASLHGPDEAEAAPSRPTRSERAVERRADRKQQEVRAVDDILQKIAVSGMESLTGGEKRRLKRATRRGQDRDDTN